MNFDFLGFTQRIGTASSIAQIISRHPEWNHPARKINDTLDRKNTHSWKGDTKVDSVNLELCWNRGLIKAVSSLRESKVFTDSELNYNLIRQNEPDVCILRPTGKDIGVLAGA